MDKKELQDRIVAAVRAAQAKNPLVPSITNNVTINLVANTQLAVGGSAAMVYLPDEGVGMADIGDAMYINMGTLLPVHAESMLRTAAELAAKHKPWVLDPVGIGVGAERRIILAELFHTPPTIVRGNASELIALADLWGVENLTADSGVRGVDSTDSITAALRPAMAVAKAIKGVVAVSGACDLVTDGSLVAIAKGGSELFTRITGAGCSLGGVTAVYAAVADAFTAALTAVQMYNHAGAAAAAKAAGPGSFEYMFRDELYQADAEAVAQSEFALFSDADPAQLASQIDTYTGC